MCENDFNKYEIEVAHACLHSFICSSIPVCVHAPSAQCHAFVWCCLCMCTGNIIFSVFLSLQALCSTLIDFPCPVMAAAPGVHVSDISGTQHEVPLSLSSQQSTRNNVLSVCVPYLFHVCLCYHNVIYKSIAPGP